MAMLPVHAHHGACRSGRTHALAFKIGDRVKYHGNLLSVGLPLWGGQTWTIIEVTQDGAGTEFARIEGDDGTVQDGIITSALVLAESDS